MTGRLPAGWQVLTAQSLADIEENKIPVSLMLSPPAPVPTATMASTAVTVNCRLAGRWGV